MNRSAQKIILLIRQWMQEQASDINHKAVRGSIFAEVEISAGYLFILNVANLIALCGLLMNSSPVIIGAMLISPLMGPILSFGFAFVTGDRVIWKRSVRKIVLSVVLTIIIASIAAFLSPLKDVTGEIISRTKPNLYDLIIAFLAGIAGASALCTKKNYLTIVPGVAIATAVIPPLSVAGFGIGTGNFAILYGGFLLFFTNFVAIVISTCIVFFFYGFRPGMIEDNDLSHLKKRFAYLFTILLIITIPLAYTLLTSVAEVRQRTLIRETLRHALDREHLSRLVNFSYKKGASGVMEINALVNTVNYLDDAQIAGAQSGLETVLGRKAKLNLEQVKVQAGGLRIQPSGIPPPAPAPRTPGELIRTAGENVGIIAGQSTAEIERIIAPSTITDFSVTFHDKSGKVSVNLVVRRDTPFSSEETLWLGRMLDAELGRRVEVAVRTVPFVPPLLFKEGETVISDDMKKEFMILRDVVKSDGNIALTVEAYPESAGKKGKRLAERRLASIVAILIRECRIPADRISTALGAARPGKPAVRISVATGSISSGKGDKK